MEKRIPLTRILIFLFASSLWAKESDPLFRPWAERQEQGDLTGALKVLLAVLKDRPGDPGAMSRLGQTTRAIEKRAQDIERLSLLDRNATVARAAQLVQKRDQETREAMINLRASYDHNWKTTPEALLHTCRGVDLQIQITLPDDDAGRRMKEYLNSLCGTLAAESKRGAPPTTANIHRVAGFLAYQRLELDGALLEWAKAKSSAPEDAALADFIRRTEDIRSKEKRRARAQEKTVLANQRLSAGEVKSALGLFKEVVDLDPGNTYAADQIQRLTKQLTQQVRRNELGRHRGRAMGFEAKGRSTEAVREWLAVLEVDPMNTEAQERVETLVAHGPSVRSLPPPSKSSLGPRDPDGASAFYSQGLLLYAEDDLPGAQTAFKQCLALDPSHPLARRAMERIALQRTQKP